MPKRNRSSSWLSALCFLSLAADQRAIGFTAVPHRRRLTSYPINPTILLFSAAPKEDLGDSIFRGFTKWLAQLSLEDYQWRTDVFKTNQADRMVEESLARMRGENATYVRPMDASNGLGPLGRWEKESVTWLQSVIDEEGRRARKIVENAGKLVRPSENREDDNVHLGPLGRFEKQVVEFFMQILNSEKMRVQTNTLRPKDLDDNFRGPLGNFELKVVAAIDEIRASEKLRYEQSKIRGGQIVRPIDVPGPLGELELKVATLFQAEQRRARERQLRGRIVRPMDAGYRGPLGDAELNAFETLQSLMQEEMERLRNIQKAMQERRPMDNDRDSLLGIAEALLVGILRAPQLFMSVVSRVTELLQSENLDDSDKEIMKQQENNKKKRG